MKADLSNRRKDLMGAGILRRILHSKVSDHLIIFV